MDRALLERMLGAVVLVLLFVVFVPALLDGRDSDQSDGETGSGDSGRRTEVIVLNAPRNEAPAPEVKPETPPAKVIVSQPASPAVTKPAPAPLPAAKPEPKPPAKPLPKTQPVKTNAPPSKGFAVQLGSFGARENAVAVAAKIRDAGYPVFIIRGAAGTNEVFRVYAGPRPTRPDAEKLAAKLKSEGQSVLVVDLGARAGG